MSDAQVAQYAARVATSLVQGILLHVYNVVGLVIVAVAIGPKWAIPQIVFGVGAVMLGGSKK